jgi:spermidine synthase
MSALLGRGKGGLAMLCLAGVAALIVSTRAAKGVDEPKKRSPAPNSLCGGAAASGDGLVFETTSAFSHFYVRDEGARRSLLFRRDSGEIVLETSVDCAAPYHLLIGYTRVMFASHFFVPKPKSALLVGLGGGAMVHFMAHYTPETRVDVVEIDSAIVKAAKDFFGVKEGGHTRIITEDAFKFFGRGSNRYDVIYMDAFLKPSGDTDATGVPVRLKTEAFLRTVQQRLNPDGVVVWNLNGHEAIGEDVRAIQKTFAQTYYFRVPGEDNHVVVGSTSSKRVSRAAMESIGATIDKRLRADFSFAQLAQLLSDRMVGSAASGLR